MKSILLSLVLVTGCLIANAQKLRDVSGEYEYYLPRHLSRAQGEQAALERAMIQALANEFGTFLTMGTQLNLSSSKDGENSDFYSYSSSMVRGEWVETVGQPFFDIYLSDKGEIVLTCKVKGRAREIRRVVDDFNMKILNGGTLDQHESANFLDGDNIYLSFKSPSDGYIAVYLEDDNNNYLRMLPFNGEGKGARKVKGNVRNLFFNSNDGLEEKYQLTTDKPTERNVIHVLFSPHPFILPVDDEGKNEYALDQLEQSQFRKWLEKSRTLDPELQHQMRPINISESVD